MTATPLAIDNVSGRELFVLSYMTPDDVLKEVQLPSNRYVCLLAWDATGASVETIELLARHLIADGCVYICAWGADCKRVHDIFDETDMALRLDADAIVMSTWHDDEPLSEAIWFALNCAWPDEAYEDDCKAVVGISIGNSNWTTEMIEAFRDPRAFSERVLASE